MPACIPLSSRHCSFIGVLALWLASSARSSVRLYVARGSSHGLSVVSAHSCSQWTGDAPDYGTSIAQITGPAIRTGGPAAPRPAGRRGGCRSPATRYRPTALRDSVPPPVATQRARRPACGPPVRRVSSVLRLLISAIGNLRVRPAGLFGASLCVGAGQHRNSCGNAFR